MEEAGCEICEYCKFWWDSKVTSRMWEEQESEKDGECRRFPPKTDGFKSFNPKVKATGWCGEFKKK